MNKFILILLFLTGNIFSVIFARSYSYQKKSLPIQQRVQGLLGRMTLEEKIAELNLIPYNVKSDSACRAPYITVKLVLS